MAHVTPLHPLIKLNGDCWEWLGTSSSGGYGMAWQPERRRMSYWHRLNYEHFVEPIPDGYQIDHLCRNPPCCNPAHLEAVTPRENWHRGEAPSAQRARQDHCKNGHRFSTENTYISKAGKRSCRACAREYKRDHLKEYHREYMRAWRRRKTEQGSA